MAAAETDDLGHGSVLRKAVLILRAFAADEYAVTLAELTRRTGLHKATVHRLARELVELGLLERGPTGYRLAVGLFELGMRAAKERSLLEVTMPFLQELSERTHELVHLAVREGNEVVYVAKLGGRRQAKSPSRIGGRMPTHCTAVGKILLAHDDDLRRRVLTAPLPRLTPHTIVAPGLLRRQLDVVTAHGVAFEHEESALGLACVACPVFSPSGEVAAAISITGPTSRFRPEAHSDVVRATANAISATLARRENPHTHSV